MYLFFTGKLKIGSRDFEVVSLRMSETCDGFRTLPSIILDQNGVSQSENLSNTLTLPGFTSSFSSVPLLGPPDGR